MADYTGVALEWTESEKRTGRLIYGEIIRYCMRWRMSTAKKVSGDYSMCLSHGGQYDIPFGVDAGTKTVTVQCWAPSGALAHLKVAKIDGEVIDRATAVASGAWEELSVTFVAEKGIYVAKLENTSKADGDMACYFDDLLVE